MSFNRVNEIQLGDIVEEITVGYVGSMTKEYIDNGVPFLRSLNIEPYKINLNSIKYVSSEFHQKLKKSSLKQGDVVIVRTGKPGTCAVIPDWIGEVNCSDIVIIRPGKNIDPYYLEAYINILATNHIDAYTVGAVQQHFNVASAKKIKIALPEINTQKKIGNISRLINDKISINNKMIEILEETAAVFFKKLFIDTEEPEENWKVTIEKERKLKSLDEIASYKNGLAMQKFRPENEEVGLPVLKIRELNQGCVDEKSERCTSSISDEVKITAGDVVFSWSGTLLVKIWSDEDAGLNQHLFKVTSKKMPKWYYYFATKYHLQKFIAIAADKATTMGHIKRQHLSEAKVYVPNEEILRQVSITFQPIMDKIINLGIENKKLYNLRDTLLPKLLSGVIEIPGESVVEPS